MDIVYQVKPSHTSEACIRGLYFKKGEAITGFNIPY